NVRGMGRRTPGEGELGRANEPPLLILTSLAAGSKHGYALARDIQDFAGVSLGPGTLYGAITRLEERGLIEPVGEADRRRPYRLTDNGRAELAKAVGQMRAIADVGAARLAGSGTPPVAQPDAGAGALRSPRRPGMSPLRLAQQSAGTGGLPIGADNSKRRGGRGLGFGWRLGWTS
ncbi:MAG TPA: PadR family transcriptional regulator, partial [Streptosporangiaceae bacterium]|nr:PadR family transcriptional regulator [Streptosporangiaceae bacterium]